MQASQTVGVRPKRYHDHLGFYIIEGGGAGDVVLHHARDCPVVWKCARGTLEAQGQRTATERVPFWARYFDASLLRKSAWRSTYVLTQIPVI